MSPPGPFRLCYITDRQTLKPQELRLRISDAARAGVDLIQVREKDLATRELAELVRFAVEATRGTAAKLVVNDRLDVALGLGAAGVHLGRESIPARDARRLAPADFLVGVSCHSLDEARAAEASGADYILLGPIFATPSKLRYGPPLGIDKLREVSQQAKIPILALGGITIERARDCRKAGAAGIAAIRLFQEADSIKDLVRELRVGLE
jgi:thiamine-phosphate pyrophosphorylase